MVMTTEQYLATERAWSFIVCRNDVSGMVGEATEAAGCAADLAAELEIIFEPYTTTRGADFDTMASELLDQYGRELDQWEEN
jgi:hypothetical protein